MVAGRAVRTGEGLVVSTYAKLLWPSTQNPTLADWMKHVRRAAKGRHVIVDEFHRWTDWLSLGEVELPAKTIPPINTNPWLLGDPKDAADPEFVASLDAWLAAQVRAAADLFKRRKSYLKTLQRRRHKLLVDRLHRTPLTPDGANLGDLGQLLARHAAALPRPPTNAAKPDFLGQLTALLRKAPLGDLVVSASLVDDAPETWSFRVAVQDIENRTEGDRLMRLPRFTVVRNLAAAAVDVGLLSATPRPHHEVRYALGEVDWQPNEPAPRLDILLEQSARNQRNTTFRIAHEDNHPAKELIAEAVRAGKGVLFLRSKDEHDHLRWKELLPGKQRSYCRAPDSVGMQSFADFVALAGPPHLPFSLEPHCFVDPVDTPQPALDARTAAEAGAQARFRLMLQELYQASGRTARHGRPGRAIVFGCHSEIVRRIHNSDNLPSWLRGPDRSAHLSVLNGQGSSEYRKRLRAIRWFLAGVDLSYESPPRAKDSQEKRRFARPAIISEYQWILELIRAGELPNPVTQRAYEVARYKGGRKRGNLLREIAYNWVPRTDGSNGRPVERFVGVEEDSWPVRFHFKLEPLDLGWPLQATKAPKIRRRRIAS